MAKPRGHTPIRTCISCGTKRNKSELIRFVIEMEGNLVKDNTGKMHGRGAYVCKSDSCHELLLSNRRLKRRFRTDKVITVCFDKKNSNDSGSRV